MTPSVGAPVIAFWAAALAMVTLAWVLLCLPLMRRSGGPARDAANAAVLAEQLQALDGDLASGRIDSLQHRAAQTEIHRRLLDEAGSEVPPGTSMAAPATRSKVDLRAAAAPPRRPGTHPGLFAALAVGLPAFAIGGYLTIGNPAALSVPAAAAPAAAAREASPEDVAAMVDTLAERLRQRPGGGAEDVQGWIMLGRSYAALQRFDDAAKAFARASTLAPDDPQLLADQADMLAMQQGQRLEGEPRRLIEQALALDPKQLKALALAGSAAFERRQWAEASAYWRRARALVADGSDLAQGLDRSLAEVAAAGGGGDLQTAGPSLATPNGRPDVVAEARRADSAVPANSTGPSDRAAPGVSTSSVSGQVSLSPALAAHASAGDTVFVFARAAQGPRMPLAILRRTVADLPLTFRLDDSMAMSPALKVSNFVDLVVGVRISRSGNAMPQPGDLIGETPAKAGGNPVQVTIDRVQP